MRVSGPKDTGSLLVARGNPHPLFTGEIALRNALTLSEACGRYFGRALSNLGELPGTRALVVATSARSPLTRTAKVDLTVFIIVAQAGDFVNSPERKQRKQVNAWRVFGEFGARCL